VTAVKAEWIFELSRDRPLTVEATCSARTAAPACSRRAARSTIFSGPVSVTWGMIQELQVGKGGADVVEKGAVSEGRLDLGCRPMRGLTSFRR
jgi:hypothetical protein